MSNRRGLTIAGCLALAMASPAHAQSTTSAAPTMEEVLPVVLRGLAAYLPDARGITDMRVCAPTHIRTARDGRVTGYTISMQLNAPTSQGGMSGRQVFYAIVRDGRARIIENSFQRPADNGGQPSGLDGLLGGQAMRSVEGCQRIPDADVSAVLLRMDQE